MPSPYLLRWNTRESTAAFRLRWCLALSLDEAVYRLQACITDAAKFVTGAIFCDAGNHLLGGSASGVRWLIGCSVLDFGDVAPV